MRVRVAGNRLARRLDRNGLAPRDRLGLADVLSRDSTDRIRGLFVSGEGEVGWCGGSVRGWCGSGSGEPVASRFVVTGPEFGAGEASEFLASLACCGRGSYTQRTCALGLAQHPCLDRPVRPAWSRRQIPHRHDWHSPVSFAGYSPRQWSGSAVGLVAPRTGPEPNSRRAHRRAHAT
jgi:hypothetical protein